MGNRVNSEGIIDYSEYHLTRNISDNIASFKKIFQEDNTVLYRVFESKDKKIHYGAVYIDGMIDKQVINVSIIKPLMENSQGRLGTTLEDLEQTLVSVNEIKRESEFGELVKSVLYGDTILFVEGHHEALIVGSKGFSTRSITEPDAEKALKGPREGFNEALMTNLSLVRRKLQTADLKFVFSSAGTRSGTRICLCYLDSLIDKQILNELKKRLDSIKLDGILDANYILEHIQDHKNSPFKTVGSTEKPDILASRLLEGRIAIFVDGSPFVLTVPFLFVENFQSPDDYYLHFFFATLGRLLRIAGFFLTLSVPAIYVALVNYHQEIIPSSLMLTIAAATAGVPFPTVVECIGMLVLFEVLRETGIRSSNKIGQAISIVGGLVVGQAAVEAKIVSAPMVIVVALTGITGLIIPKLKGATIMIRFASILMATCSGILGYYFIMALVWIHLLSMKSFGYPFLQDFFPAKRPASKDSGVRAPLYANKKRPDFAADPYRR